MLIILAAQSEELQSKALDTVTQLVQGGVTAIAIVLVIAILVLVVFGGRIITQMLAFISRVTAAIESMDKAVEKVSDQSAAQSTVLAELAVNLRESKQSSDAVVAEVKLNTKATVDFLHASSSGMNILNRSLLRTETFFKDRINGIESLLIAHHSAILAAIAEASHSAAMAALTQQKTQPPSQPEKSEDTK